MAQTRSGITFGPYRLDVAGARLWRGDEPVAIQPRPLAVLAYLAARPGAAVSRDELIATLWSGTYVTKAVLKVAVRAIREALDDDADAPRYVETVGREGYRFIGGAAGAAPAPQRPGAAPARVTVVGREQDLARLHAGLARAMSDTRTIVFVSGEAGVGKTTLIDRFIAEVAPAGDICAARGQCLEQYGEGEAYLPILEALSGLVRDDRSGELGETLARHAPSWVSQLAVAPNQPAPSRRDAAMATMPARMLREMADALEVVTLHRVLILVLEDLQWSDPSTVDLIDCIARRRQPARLLVIGSLRPVATTAGEHPLRGVQHELQTRGLCEVIALTLLARDDVAAYIAARFADAPPAALRQLATRVWHRSAVHGPAAGNRRAYAGNGRSR